MCRYVVGLSTLDIPILCTMFIAKTTVSPASQIVIFIYYGSNKYSNINNVYFTIIYYYINATNYTYSNCN